MVVQMAEQAPKVLLMLSIQISCNTTVHTTRLVLLRVTCKDSYGRAHRE